MASSAKSSQSSFSLMDSFMSTVTECLVSTADDSLTFHSINSHTSYAQMHKTPQSKTSSTQTLKKYRKSLPKFRITACENQDTSKADLLLKYRDVLVQYRSFCQNRRYTVTVPPRDISNQGASKFFSLKDYLASVPFTRNSSCRSRDFPDTLPHDEKDDDTRQSPFNLGKLQDENGNISKMSSGGRCPEMPFREERNCQAYPSCDHQSKKGSYHQNGLDKQPSESSQIRDRTQSSLSSDCGNRGSQKITQNGSLAGSINTSEAASSAANGGIASGVRDCPIVISNLPKTSPIWDRKTNSIQIPLSVKEKYRDDLDSNEAINLLMKIINANPRQQMLTDSTLDSTRNLTDMFRLVMDCLGQEEAQKEAFQGVFSMLDKQLVDPGMLSLQLQNGQQIESNQDEAGSIMLEISDYTSEMDHISYHPLRMHPAGQSVDLIDGASNCGIASPGRLTRSVPPSNIWPHVEKAIYCQRVACDDANCLRGQKYLIEFEDVFLRDNICNGQAILVALQHHSRSCQEIACSVPLCYIFSHRNDHSNIISDLPIQQQLQTELVDTVRNQQIKDELFTLGDDVSFETWRTAEIMGGQFTLGKFCDFNIMSGVVSYRQTMDHGVRPPGLGHTGKDTEEYLNIVLKKAFSYSGVKKVYLMLSQKPSEYTVQNYWISSLPGRRLLVLSAFHQDMKSLASWCKQEVRSVDQCLALVQQAINAAQYLHSHKIIYVSWKGSSILIDDSSCSVKLCNFSKAVMVHPGKVIKQPGIKDTVDPRFAAPEVLCGNALGFFTDVWGIACLLYQLTTQNPPYPDYPHRSPSAIREMVRSNEIQHTYPQHQLSMVLCCHCWQRAPSERISLDDMASLLAGAGP